MRERVDISLRVKHEGIDEDFKLSIEKASIKPNDALEKLLENRGFYQSLYPNSRILLRSISFYAQEKAPSRFELFRGTTFETNSFRFVTFPDFYFRFSYITSAVNRFVRGNKGFKTELKKEIKLRCGDEKGNISLRKTLYYLFNVQQGYLQLPD